MQSLPVSILCGFLLDLAITRDWLETRAKARKSEDAGLGPRSSELKIESVETIISKKLNRFLNFKAVNNQEATLACQSQKVTFLLVNQK